MQNTPSAVNGVHTVLYTSCDIGPGQIREKLGRQPYRIISSTRSSDPWSAIVIVLTAGLFALPLLVKGFTHDLFFEAGIFLDFVKLILMAQTNTRTEESLERHLTRMEELLVARQFSGLPLKEK